MGYLIFSAALMALMVGRANPTRSTPIHAHHLLQVADQRPAYRDLLTAGQSTESNESEKDYN